MHFNALWKEKGFLIKRRKKTTENGEQWFQALHLN